MSLLAMVLRSLALRRVTSALLALSVALGVGLVVVIFVLSRAIDRAYENQGSGFPMLVGPRGSKADLVLSVVYQQGRGPGLLPYRVYEELAKQDWVELAVPVALGDSVGDFRVMGASEGIFSPAFQPLPGRPLTLARGRPFESDRETTKAVIQHGLEAHDLPREAVLGAEAARRLGLDVGMTLQPTHGLDEAGDHHDEEWLVTGVLVPTGTAMDRVVFVNLESFFAIEEHAAGSLVAGPDGGVEPAISAVIIYPKSKTAQSMMLPALEKRSDLMAVSPAQEIARLLAIVGDVRALLLVCAWAVVLVAGAGVATSMYGAMAARRGETAVLRALGARRSTVLGLLVVEAALLAFSGASLGLALGHSALFVLGPRLEDAAGCALELGPLAPLGAAGAAAWVPFELAMLLVVTPLGALAGVLPGLAAYRLPVAQNLQSRS
jgi:putative ABC transport system permease protein